MKSITLNLARWTAADIKELYAAVKSNDLDFKDLDKNRIKVFGEEDNLMNFLDIFFDEDDDVYEKIQNMKESNIDKALYNLTEAKSEFQKLRDNQVQLTAEEKALVKEKKAVWSDGRSAVWKSVNPKTKEVTYVTHTHRAYNTAPTLKGIIGRFHDFIKGTA